MDNPELITKGGEEWLRLSLIPHKSGLLIDVKTHRLVEDFMSSLGEGKKAAIQDSTGRASYWDAQSDDPLQVYAMKRLPAYNSTGYAEFILDQPGGSIVVDENIMNLSFLRLAGISNGIRFISTKDVFPLSYRRELKRKIGEAFRRFCLDYIKPVKITLVITSQEI